MNELTLPDKINLQIKIKFNNYQGRIWRKFILVHAKMRTMLGDEKFLEYLESRPEPPDRADCYRFFEESIKKFNSKIS